MHDKLRSAEDRIAQLEAALAASGSSVPDSTVQTKPVSRKPEVESCAVCLMDVQDDDDCSIVTLSCKHRFHLECIAMAFSSKHAMICPYCRNNEGEWKFTVDVAQWEKEQEMDAARRREIDARYTQQSCRGEQ